MTAGRVADHGKVKLCGMTDTDNMPEEDKLASALCAEARHVIRVLASQLDASTDPQIVTLMADLTLAANGSVSRNPAYFPKARTRRVSDISGRLPIYGEVEFVSVETVPNHPHIALLKYKRADKVSIRGMRVDLAEAVILDQIDGADNDKLASDVDMIMALSMTALYD